jgi:hypothetical protein
MGSSQNDAEETKHEEECKEVEVVIGHESNERIVPCRLAYERLYANGCGCRALINQRDALGLPNYPLVVTKWGIFDPTTDYNSYSQSVML